MLLLVAGAGRLVYVLETTALSWLTAPPDNLRVHTTDLQVCCGARSCLQPGAPSFMFAAHCSLLHLFV
jgi:hypothetical protein